MVEALEALAAQRGDDQDARVYAALLDRLKQGRSLASAFDDLSAFPPLLVASIRASERTSNLAQALDAYLHFDEITSQLKRRVLSSALYPLIVLGLGVAISVFLVLVVMPKFGALYGQSGSGAGGITGLLLALSTAVRRQPGMTAGAVLLLTMALGGAWRHGQVHRVAVWLVGEVPVLRAARENFACARLYEAMAMLIKGGYTVSEALTLAEQVADEDHRRQLRDASLKVSEGIPMSKALAGAGLLDAVTQRMVGAGERGGAMGEILASVASRHATQFETFVERATRLVEPVLLLAVALLVGSLVVALYMPIFDIAGSIR